MIKIIDFWRTGKDHKNDDFTARVQTEDGKIWLVGAYYDGDTKYREPDAITYLFNDKVIMTVTCDDDINEIFNHGTIPVSEVPFDILMVIGMDIERYLNPSSALSMTKS